KNKRPLKHKKISLKT
ncbi:putative uncharacterized protein, partial [Helicobacter pylori]